MKHHLISHFWPFVKYCIVGVSNTAIDFIVFWFLIESITGSIVIATAAAFLIANLNSFIWNKTWTFQNASNNWRKLYIKFLIPSLVGLGLSVLCMIILVDLLHINDKIAKLLTSGIVLTWNFLANSFWTFVSKPWQIDIPKHFQYEYSIVIPAYNEALRLPATLLLIDQYITEQKLNAEIIVVDDGSQDETSSKVKKLQTSISNLSILQHDKNRGKGAAIRTGIESSQGKYILMTDADNSTPIEELSKLTCKMNTNTIVIGSRYLSGSNVIRHQSQSRKTLGRLANILIRIAALPGLCDTQCGFKLYPHAAAKQIFARQKIKRFAFDIEALVIAKSLNLTIIEVPVSWINSTDSRVRPVRDALRSLRDLVYIKMNLWSGRYR